MGKTHGMKINGINWNEIALRQRGASAHNPPTHQIKPANEKQLNSISIPFNFIFILLDLCDVDGREKESILTVLYNHEAVSITVLREVVSTLIRSSIEYGNNVHAVFVIFFMFPYTAMVFDD